ncbi:MAG: hypothetical protein R3E48_13130 [Burkholderiaceae bacterium]
MPVAVPGSLSVIVTVGAVVSICVLRVAAGLLLPAASVTIAETVRLPSAGSDPAA